MSKKNIYITHKIIDSAKVLLEQNGHNVKVWDKSTPIPPSELLKEAKDSHAIISMLNNKIDAKFIAQCNKLEVISNYAVGYNNIDIDAATKSHIAVGNTPGVLTDATADLAMALLLNLSRKICPAKENVLQGHWKNWEPMGFLGKSLKGKTLGIYGLGRIGQAFAKRCVDGFGMNLIYCARSEKSIGEKVDFDTLLKRSDVISIHSPLNKETQGLFNKDTLSKTKKDCILINTARGEVIIEEDLISLLKTDHFFGVGLDVTAPEPIELNSELLKFENVLITPHIGSADLETRTAMSEMVANNLLAAFNKQPLPGFVNPDVWD